MCGIFKINKNLKTYSNNWYFFHSLFNISGTLERRFESLKEGGEEMTSHIEKFPEVYISSDKKDINVRGNDEKQTFYYTKIVKVSYQI